MRPFILLVLMYVLTGCTNLQKEEGYARVEGVQFIVNGEPYYFMGANMWYAAILASDGEGGDTLRLFKELDFLKELGVNNIRVLVGAEGERGVHSKIEPILQPAPGVYNDTLLRGLDRLMVELEKRDMMAVLYLGNSWEWVWGVFSISYVVRCRDCPYPGYIRLAPFQGLREQVCIVQHLQKDV